jgi:CheY-like chemotaxis protein
MTTSGRLSVAVSAGRPIELEEERATMSSPESATAPAVGVADATAAEPAPVDTVTIVFAGDDPGLVQLLRVATTRWRGAWDVHFVQSGQGALARFGELPRVDVVAAHMHVPGLTVADLLSEIPQCSPLTARIALSDQSDRESVLDLIGIAHQVMPMPRDVELLTDLIEQVRSGVSARLPLGRTVEGGVDELRDADLIRFMVLGNKMFQPNCSHLGLRSFRRRCGPPALER